jgi:hypothetical protein
MASAGNPNGNSVGSALIGAAIGGIVGSFIGWDSYNKKNDHKVKTSNQPGLPPQVEVFDTSSGDGKTAKLRPAQVRVRYVEDQIKDGTFIPAHFEYEISDQAHWETSK